jgi:hypothetical protein
MKAPHTCVIQINSLLGITRCGKPATLYDRARKEWICTEHHRERLCEFCQCERAWARVQMRPHLYASPCEVWLCALLRGNTGTVGPEITAACSHQSHPVTRPLSQRVRGE